MGDNQRNIGITLYRTCIVVVIRFESGKLLYKVRSPPNETTRRSRSIYMWSGHYPGNLNKSHNLLHTLLRRAAMIMCINLQSLVFIYTVYAFVCLLLLCRLCCLIVKSKFLLSVFKLINKYACLTWVSCS